jgi:tetratricopeptide (TPR) repeat protein
LDERHQRWLEEGIAAARSGDAERARANLLRVVEVDARNVQAWYWLGRVVQDPHEREICLENVLALDPGHMALQDELAQVRRQMAETDRVEVFSANDLAAAIPRTAEERLASEAAIEPLPCPYCAGITGAQARLCIHCHQPLYLRRPKSKKHSVYSLGLVALWFALANYTWLGLVGYYFLSTVTSARQGSPEGGGALNVLRNLLGIEGRGPTMPELPLLPVLLAGGLIFGLSLLVAWGLYRRRRAFYWLTVGLIMVYPLVIVYRVASTGALTLLGVAIDLLLFLPFVSLAFMAYDEFTTVEERLDASVDRDVDSHSALYIRGQSYAGQGMWAKAAAHWSRAVAMSAGNIDYRLALALACTNLGQFDRAREHLVAARQIAPDNAEVHALAARLSNLSSL